MGEEISVVVDRTLSSVRILELITSFRDSVESASILTITSYLPQVGWISFISWMELSESTSVSE